LNQQVSRNLEGMDAEPIESDDSGGTPVAPHSPKNNNSDGRLSYRGSESRESMHNMDEHSRKSMQSGNSPNDSPRSTPNAMPTFQVSLNLNANAKKMKIVSHVFQNDDDQEEINGHKKRKLVPLGKFL